MKYEEFKELYANLSERQRKWLGHKARWEGESLWAVIENGWTPPADEELNEDGTTA